MQVHCIIALLGMLCSASQIRVLYCKLKEKVHACMHVRMHMRTYVCMCMYVRACMCVYKQEEVGMCVYCST